MDSLARLLFSLEIEFLRSDVEFPGAHQMVGAPMTFVFSSRILVCAAFLVAASWSCEGCTPTGDPDAARTLAPNDVGFADKDALALDPLCQGRRVAGAPCNGSEQFCDRRYDEVSYVTTHNAMSNQDEGWLAPNHIHGLRQQWEDGVRAMMIDTHYDDEGGEEVPSLCHGSCRFGSIDLSVALADMEAFLRCNPEQVLTLIVEAYVSPEDTEAAFEEAGLLSYVYTHSRGADWPTLGAMIESGQRLVVLSDDGGSPEWYMNLWEHAFETPFAAERSGDLVCEKNRGDSSNSLFVLNHFLTAPLASQRLAEQVNTNPFLVDRATECREAFGRIPNFVTVDFYSVGDVFAATADLNRL